MQSLRTLAITAAAATLGLVGCAQTPVDPTAHDPGAAPASGMPMAMGGQGAPMSRMDEQMKAMQAQHDKMLQAKTPGQRDALMAEHMKVMQDSMAVMCGMGPGGMMGKDGMGMHHQMMEKRMQMMQSMMQMMMDRMPPAPSKP